MTIVNILLSHTEIDAGLLAKINDFGKIKDFQNVTTFNYYAIAKKYKNWTSFLVIITTFSYAASYSVDFKGISFEEKLMWRVETGTACVHLNAQLNLSPSIAEGQIVQFNTISKAIRSHVYLKSRHEFTSWSKRPKCHTCSYPKTRHNFQNRPLLAEWVAAGHWTSVPQQVSLDDPLWALCMFSMSQFDTGYSNALCK